MWLKTPAASATHAKENYSDKRRQFKRIQQTKLIYHSPAAPERKVDAGFILHVVAQMSCLKGSHFFYPFPAKSNLGK